MNYVNWKPTLLYYDNHQVYGSPSYYVQKLFMNYQGKYLLMTEDDLPARVRDIPQLNGEISFSTTQAEAEITEFCFRDLESGKQEEMADFELSADHAYQKCLDTQSCHYEISFRFRKRNGNTSGNLNGAYSFELGFAGRDEENVIKWTIDGWQRLTSLRGICNGCDCDMGLHFFASERDRVYEARLLVENGQIKTYIDGQEYCSHICRSAEPDELYYSAVRENDGTVIVKAVNAQEEAKALNIILHGKEGQGGRVDVLAMEGYQPGDRNSFEEPQKVIPVERTYDIHGNEFRYMLPGNSMAVLCFAK